MGDDDISAELLRKAEEIMGFTPPTGMEKLEEFYWPVVRRVANALEDIPREMSEEEEDIVQEITRAFKGVQCLDEPMVLLGGEAADEGEPPEVMDYLSAVEEREDWTRIHPALLTAATCSLGYVGPEALRFLAPAFMCAGLRYGDWLWQHTTYVFVFGFGSTQDYSLFTPEQMHAVARFVALETKHELTPPVTPEDFAPWLALLEE